MAPINGQLAADFMMTEPNPTARKFVLAPLPGPEIYEGVEKLGFEADPQSWVSAQSTIFEELCAKHKAAGKFDTIIEVGIHKGVSTRKWAYGLDPFGETGKIYAVDTWLQAADAYMNATNDWKMVYQNGHPMTYWTFLMNVKATQQEKQIVPIILPSFQAHLVLKAHKIKAQIISVDGDHTHEGAYRDIKDFWPLLEVGGSMLLDDLRLYPTVYSACLQFVGENNLWDCFEPIKDGEFGLFTKRHD